MNEYRIIAAEGGWAHLCVSKEGRAVYVGMFFATDGEDLAAAVADLALPGATPASWDGNEIDAETTDAEQAEYNAWSSLPLGGKAAIGGKVVCANGEWLPAGELGNPAGDARLYLLTPEKLESVEDCRLYAERVNRGDYTAEEDHVETNALLWRALRLLDWQGAESLEPNLETLNAIAAARDGEAAVGLRFEDADGEETEREKAAYAVFYGCCLSLRVGNQSDGAKLLNAIAAAVFPESTPGGYDWGVYDCYRDYESVAVDLKKGDK